jgi:hypothetical protein
LAARKSRGCPSEAHLVLIISLYACQQTGLGVTWVVMSMRVLSRQRSAYFMSFRTPSPLHRAWLGGVRADIITKQTSASGAKAAVQRRVSTAGAGASPGVPCVRSARKLSRKAQHVGSGRARRVQWRRTLVGPGQAHHAQNLACPVTAALLPGRRRRPRRPVRRRSRAI